MDVLEAFHDIEGQNETFNEAEIKEGEVSQAYSIFGSLIVYSVVAVEGICFNGHKGLLLKAFTENFFEKEGHCEVDIEN